MKRLALIIAITITFGAAPAAAQCYADYKAKQDNPLQLHYGVVELPERACGSTDAAAREISGRIATDGWTLLNVVSIFGQDDLTERRESAGEYFLRY